MSEEIIKRKLLFEGEGIGDDTRINIFQKKLVKWINTNYDSKHANEIAYNEILSLLGGIEYSRRKSDLVRKRYEIDIDIYRLHEKKIEDDVAHINEILAVSKVLLAEAQEEYKTKMKCSIIASKIKEQEMYKSTSKIQEEISKIKVTKIKLARNWQKWQQQVQLTLNCTDQLNEIM